MTFEEQQNFASQVADLNKYGQALNQCSTVEEVVSLTLEAMSVLFQFSHTTFVEVREDGPRVVHSTNPKLSPGETPSEIGLQAVETGETITKNGAEAGIESGSETTAWLAVPAKMGGDVTTVLVTRSTTVEAFGDEHSRPMTILASHAATAISNIRSRERLERARRDLENRKEMIEMYDRLLRHDLGNDLQVIAGFADAVAADVDGETARYASKIQRAAESAADLIERVGDLVSTLESQEEPEPRDLQAILSQTVSEVAGNYPSLTVTFDPEVADYHVYGGDLLDSVFTNVLSNATVHNDGDVTVAVSTEEHGTDEVVVTFADDGEGVAEEIRSDLFEMGKKGPESGGTGFGLGFVKALTESYGGNVSAGDSQYGGAAFRISLERV